MKVLDSSLPAILGQRALANPKAIAYRFLPDGEVEAGCLTYGELDRQARALALGLMAVCQRHDRVLLAYPAGLDFIAAFFACLYAQVIPVAACLPHRSRSRDLHLGRGAAIAADCQPKLRLSVSSARSRLPSSLGPWGFTDEMTFPGNPKSQIPNPAADDIAFLQYTSGSTQHCRGVAVTHRALMEQLEYYRLRAGKYGGEGAVSLGWLPHHHDFGLVGFILNGVYMGVPYVFMAPSAFFQKPVRWLAAISRYRATYSGGPNSAYELCAESHRDSNSQDLDLSSWQIASVGGEPIFPATLEKFARKFEPWGFRQQSFLPAYGLAEAVLCVTARQGLRVQSFEAIAPGQNRVKPVPASGAGTLSLVSCGSTLVGQELRIVEPQTRQALPPGEVGEIWLAGKSLASGYWQNEPETTACFQVTVLGEGDTPYLRTGDCGFIWEGDLFIAGRLKDLLVIWGENHFPEALEVTMQSVDPALSKGGGAVFQVEQGTESPVIAIQEVKRGAEIDPATVCGAIARAVAETHGIKLDAIELIAANSLPRTTSGKVCRHECRTAFLASRLSTVFRWPAEPLPPAPTPSLPPPQEQGSTLEEMAAAILQELRVLNQLTTQQLKLLQGLNGDRLAPAASPVEDSREQSSQAENFPLTAAQKEILTFLALHPDAAPAFTQVKVLEWQQPPVRQALQLALQALAQRHDALRLRIGEQEQQVLATVCPDVCRVELGDESAIANWLRQEKGQGFDLEQAPLWRVSILSTATSGQFLVFTAHALILDRESFAAWVQEFVTYYEGFCLGQLPALPTPMSFQAFSLAKAQQQQGEGMQAHKDCWPQRLGSQLPLLDLPGGKIGYEAACHSLELREAQRASLMELGARQSATLFQTLLCAYAILLQRLTNQERIAVGMAATEVLGDGAVKAMGCCQALGPVVVEFAAQQSLAELQQSVRQQLLSALNHQDYTLTMLARDLRLPLASQQPFEIAAAMTVQQLAGEMPGCTPRLDLEAAAAAHSPFALTLEAIDLGTSLRLNFIYNTTLFQEAAIERFSGYYRQILEGMGQETKLSELQVLSDREQQQILAWSRQGPIETSRDSYSLLFAAQVARSPDALAVVCQQQRLTYQQLEAQVEWRAIQLGQEKIAPGSLVAVLGKRSSDYLIALLAVLKAGCVYFPLDLRLPVEQLRQQVARVAPRGIFYTEDCRELAIALVEGMDSEGPVAIALTSRDGAAGPAEGPFPGDDIDLASPAYVIYTSGVTGAPKAAIASHQGLLNHLRAKIRDLSLNSEDIVAQTAVETFNISIWQFLAPLLVGARVQILDDTLTAAPAQLLAELDRQGVTVFQALPSLIRALVEVEMAQPKKYRLVKLRWLISTGETLIPELCRRWIGCFPRIPLLNAYSITEASDSVTHHPIYWPPSPSTRRLPVGRPIPGVEVYVLDRHSQLVPTGTPGELYLGGACVGLGYWQDPQGTAAAFVPAPHPLPPGTLYRTGDRVRFLEDGTLEFLGRVGQPWQINGSSIEPGEVESVLQLHPAVRQSLVTIQANSRGEDKLAAYVILKDGATASAGSLKALVRRRLPPSQVPSAVVFLDKFPTTLTGKIDLNALPPPPLRRREAEIVPPTTALEGQLVEIWREVLHQPTIGIEDDLFELGGGSLEAVAIASRLENRFNVKISISTILRQPTVAGLASYLENQLA